MISDILSVVFGPAYKGIEYLASTALGKALEALIQIIYSWLVGMLDIIATWWLEIDPVGASENSGVVNAISDTTRPLAAALGTAGLIVGLVRVGRSQGAREDTSILVEGLMRVAIAGGVAIPGTQLLMGFSTEFSPWAYRFIVGIAEGEVKALSEMLPQDLSTAVTGLGAMAIIGIGPWMLLASLIQALMAMGTDIAASLLSAVLPVTAAASVTAQGNRAFWKQVGWIFSCVAFKPAAAIIYGAGVALTIGGNFSTVNGTSNPVLSMIAGLMVIILACFSLPSLVALVAPMAGVLGSSGGRFISAATGAAVGAIVVTAAGAMTAGAGAVAATGAGAAGGAGGVAGGSAAGASGGSAAGASITATSSAGGASATGAEAAGEAGPSTATSSEGSSSKAISGAGEPSATALGAEESAATGGTPGTGSGTSSSPGTGESIGADEIDATSSESFSQDGATGTDSSAPENTAGSSTPGPRTSTSDSGAAHTADSVDAPSSDVGSNAPGTGASSEASASSTDPADTSSSSTYGTSGTNSSSGISGTSTRAKTPSEFASAPSTGASVSTSSAISSPRQGATTTNSTYRPRGGSAAHDAARYLQDMTRAIGDETEGAIRPEGAGQ